ncbi:hypothetical protein DNU06_13905 [Putridiphycobacter roseus]|uniref:OmpH family outer membrane protein n=1 Tax=Putridiphycobacter roseus TaxID=2219161 RepID=A0A2W1NNN8_9FLAO|nr:OmpH family outer membrane protein [Putridiphycobacter roseus]PZE16218.1 hypothetical protein DNU06_13905 [Putridiphycobacter roseus]
MENKNTLAKAALAINVVLIILVIILFTKVGKGNNTVENPSITSSDSNAVVSTPVQSATGKIAFFNMDSLNSKLKLFGEIEKEIKNAGIAAEDKMRRKQRDIDAWKSKWEKKGKLLSTEEAQYYKEAEKIQNEAMQFEQNVQMKLAQEQEQYMQTYALRISNFASDFAKKNGYDVVFSYQFGQSPWYYHESLDITNALAKDMNADFAASTTPEGEK